jgi:membrane protein insertase Oxa1/YidC/SpoIIIJ
MMLWDQVVDLFRVMIMAYAQACVGNLGAGGRFLWIGNIARPDMVLTMIVTAVTCASIAYSASGLPQQGRPLAILFPVIATFLILAKTSAGLGLYWGVSAAASLVQSMVIGRSARAQAAA